MVRLQDNSLVLHIWPGRWGLLSIEPECLCAVLYLQLAVPGKFCIRECNNPDLSPSGQLPYLVHEHLVITSLHSIIKFVSGLRPSSQSQDHSNGLDHVIKYDLDTSLTSAERAQRFAWVAHMESKVGDLVSHMFYSLQANWNDVTFPTFTSMLPIPQRYYVPNRIRESYQPKLEAAGLWSLPGIEQEKKRPFGETPNKQEDADKRKDHFSHVFEREKVLEKSRAILDKYSRLLAEKAFFYRERPTSLDVILAGHILLLTEVAFPDPLIQTLLYESYPSLVNHARLIRAQASSACPSIRSLPPPAHSVRSLLPSWPAKTAPVVDKRNPKTPEDVIFDRWRWAWVSGAAVLFVGAVAYTIINLGIKIEFLTDDSEKVEEEIEQEEVGGEGIEEVLTETADEEDIFEENVANEDNDMSG